jgi:hypothetical protein
MSIILCVSPPWSSFHVHAPSLVATTPYHIHLHHMCCLCLTQEHLTHGISNLVSLITKINQTWAFNLSLFGNWWQPSQRYKMKTIFNFDSISSPYICAFMSLVQFVHICMDLNFGRVTTIKLMLRYIEWTFEAWYQSKLPLYTILSIDVARHHL